MEQKRKKWLPAVVAVVFLSAGLLAAGLTVNKKINDIGGQLTFVSGQLAELETELKQADGNKIVYDMHEDGGKTTVTVKTDVKEQVYRFYQLPMQTGNQGMSYVIEAPDGMLFVIDGGFKGDGEYLMNFLEEKGGKVKAWFITHPHVDHGGAFLYYMNAADRQGITVEQVYYSPFTADYFQTEAPDKDLEHLNEYIDFEEFEQVRAEHDELLFTPLLTGDTLEFGQMKLTCLHSFDPEIYDVNSNSLVMHLDIKGYKILITGDITDGSIYYITRRIGEDSAYWPVNCLQAPHHGFGGNTDWIFRLTRPELVTMDLSLHQYYDRDEEGVRGAGHLGTQEMARYLEEQSIPVLRSFDGPNVIVID